MLLSVSRIVGMEPRLTNVAVLVTIPRSFLPAAVTFGFTVVCVVAVAVIGALRQS